MLRLCCVDKRLKGAPHLRQVVDVPLMEQNVGDTLHTGNTLQEGLDHAGIGGAPGS